jgi:hypothetical protein
MRAERPCCICLWRPVWAKDRCSTCLSYLRRHKVDRPELLIVSQGQRILERRLAAEARIGL